MVDKRKRRPGQAYIPHTCRNCNQIIPIPFKFYCSPGQYNKMIYCNRDCEFIFRRREFMMLDET